MQEKLSLNMLVRWLSEVPTMTLTFWLIQIFSTTVVKQRLSILAESLDLA
jgi:uncharacterized membrane-anchored protein